MEPELVAWKVKVGQKQAGIISRRAMKVGSRVDQIIKTGSSAGKGDSQEVISCILGWERWYKDYKQPKFEVCTRLYDESRQLTGEPDIFLTDSNCLLDIKCAGMINQKYWLQLAAYASMMTKPPATIGILRLHKSIGEYEYKVREFDERLVDVFNGMLMAYNYLCPNGDNKGEANGHSNGEAETSPTDSAV